MPLLPWIDLLTISATIQLHWLPPFLSTILLILTPTTYHHIILQPPIYPFHYPPHPFPTPFYPTIILSFCLLYILLFIHQPSHSPYFLNINTISSMLVFICRYKVNFCKVSRSLSSFLHEAPLGKTIFIPITLFHQFPSFNSFIHVMAMKLCYATRHRLPR